MINFDFHHHHLRPRCHGTLTVVLVLNVDSTQTPVFSPSASISCEGNADSATSASLNTLKTQDHSSAVRGGHAVTIHYLYPLTQLLVDKTWLNNKGNANEYAFT